MKRRYKCGYCGGSGYLNNTPTHCNGDAPPDYVPEVAPCPCCNKQEDESNTYSGLNAATNFDGSHSDERVDLSSKGSLITFLIIAIILASLSYGIIYAFQNAPESYISRNGVLFAFLFIGSSVGALACLVNFLLRIIFGSSQDLSVRRRIES